MNKTASKRPTSRKKGGGKSASKISVQKTTVVKKGQKDALVKEEYKRTGKGRAKTGFTATRSTVTAKNASQRGSSNRAKDKARTARAPGKRAQVGRSGKKTVYYEYRENRSDASASHARRL